MDFTTIVDGKVTFLGTHNVKRFFQKIHPIDKLERVNIPVKYLGDALFSTCKSGNSSRKEIPYLVNKCKENGLLFKYREIRSSYYKNSDNSIVSELILSLCSETISLTDIIFDSMPYRPKFIFERYPDEVKKIDPSLLLYLLISEGSFFYLTFDKPLETLFSIFDHPITDNHGSFKYIFKENHSSGNDSRIYSDDIFLIYWESIKKNKILIKSRDVQNMKILFGGDFGTMEEEFIRWYDWEMSGINAMKNLFV